MKHITTTLIIIFIALITAAIRPAHAAQVEADAAGKLAIHSNETQAPDNRTTHLRAYLESHNSPMAQDAHMFVEEADLNGLDWKFVAAIAGTESTFGKHVPGGSYNGWGWGIPTGAQSGVAFKDWKHGIQTVSRGLKDRYVDRGAETIEQIGRIYAASPRWAGNVRFFMDKIEAFVPTDPTLIEPTI